MLKYLFLLFWAKSALVDDVQNAVAPSLGIGYVVGDGLAAYTNDVTSLNNPRDTTSADVNAPTKNFENGMAPTLNQKRTFGLFGFGIGYAAGTGLAAAANAITGGKNPMDETAAASANAETSMKNPTAAPANRHEDDFEKVMAHTHDEKRTFGPFGFGIGYAAGTGLAAAAIAAGVKNPADATANDDKDITIELDSTNTPTHRNVDDLENLMANTQNQKRTFGPLGPLGFGIGYAAGTGLVVAAVNAATAVNNPADSTADLDAVADATVADAADADAENPIEADVLLAEVGENPIEADVLVVEVGESPIEADVLVVEVGENPIEADVLVVEVPVVRNGYH